MVFFYCVSFSQGSFGSPSPPLSSYQHLVALLVGQRHPLLVHPSTCDTRDGFISDASVLKGVRLWNFPPSLSTCPTIPNPAPDAYSSHSRCLLPSLAISECPSETSVASPISSFRYKRSSPGKILWLFRHHCFSVSYPLSQETHLYSLFLGY